MGALLSSFSADVDVPVEVKTLIDILVGITVALTLTAVLLCCCLCKCCNRIMCTNNCNKGILSSNDTNDVIGIGQQEEGSWGNELTSKNSSQKKALHGWKKVALIAVMCAIVVTIIALAAIVIYFLSIQEKPRCCDKGWTISEDRKNCYMVGSKEMEWFEALSYCMNMSANLASIHNIIENNFIWNLAKKSTFYPVWIGAKRVFSDWRWQDNTIFNYSYWGPKEPNNAKSCGRHFDAEGQDCVCLFTDDALWSGRWYDECCTLIDLLPVCQKPVSRLDCTP